MVKKTKFMVVSRGHTPPGSLSVSGRMIDRFRKIYILGQYKRRRVRPLDGDKIQN